MKEFELGYPNLAAFHSSDEVFLVFRKYNYLQSRLLLEKQEELRVLEMKLDKFDESDRAECRTRYDRESSASDDVSPARLALLQEIEASFLSYGSARLPSIAAVTVRANDSVANMISASKQMDELERPTPTETRSVRRYLHGNKPVLAGEREHIMHTQDLVTLRRSQDPDLISHLVERVLHRAPLPFKVCRFDNRNDPKID